MSKLAEARAKAIEIENETERKANSHERVGGALRTIVDAIDEQLLINESPGVPEGKQKRISRSKGREYTAYDGVWVEF